jgi:hypothetical protein
MGMGINNGPPVAIGVVTLSSATIGGGRSANRAQTTFPFKAAPDIQFGDTTAWRVVFGDGSPAIDGPPPPGGFAADIDEPVEEPAAS